MIGRRRRSAAALALVAGLLSTGSALAAPEYAARVLTRRGPVESEWTEIFIEGDSDAALERCQRQVRSLTRKRASTGLLAREIARDCALSPLPPRGAPAEEALVLRTVEELVSPELFTIGSAGTRGRVVTYVPMQNAAACERAARGEGDEEPKAQPLDDEKRKGIAKTACADAQRMEDKQLALGRAHRKVTKTQRMNLKIAQQRCRELRDAPEAAPRRRAAADPNKSCVRE